MWGAKLQGWISAVTKYTLEEVRKISGYHDEPLKGKRAGQRSIRLTKGYRAIYAIGKNNEIEFVLIEEVNHHEY
jgi:proteic killer suppression protein